MSLNTGAGKAPFYSCVLFDLDGTILDTTKDITTAVNATLRDFSLPERTSAEVRSYLNNGARVLITRAVPEEMSGNEDFISEVLACYMPHYTAVCAKESVIYDGVKEVLEELRKKGVALGIVTNKPDEQTQIINPHYFGDLFSYCRGADQKAPTKPDRTRVDMALEALGKTHDETLFVGDSWVDAQTAKNAGIKSVGVTWGFGGRKAFEKCSPDVFADTATELFDIICKGI